MGKARQFRKAFFLWAEGKGSFTALDVAEQFDISETDASHRIAKYRREGKLAIVVDRFSRGERDDAGRFQGPSAFALSASGKAAADYYAKEG